MGNLRWTDIMLCILTVVYQNFKTSYWFHRQKSSSSKKAANRWKPGCTGDSEGGNCLYGKVQEPVRGMETLE